VFIASELLWVVRSPALVRAAFGLGEKFRYALVGVTGRKARFGGFLRLWLVSHLVMFGALPGAVLPFFAGKHVAAQ